MEKCFSKHEFLCQSVFVSTQLFVAYSNYNNCFTILFLSPQIFTKLLLFFDKKIFLL